jgi:LmbE family N-acetylglucosaminyl deacetylase
MEPAFALPAFSRATRLLVVAPHPDDETIATGVLIQQVRAAGGEVHILLLTSGDNNPWPQRWLERRWRIGASERQRWGRRRQLEMLQALRRLDVAESALHAMGWPDMGITERLRQHSAEMIAAMAEAVLAFGPNLIALPALDDSHPDHSAAHVLMRLALARSEPLPMLAYRVHGKGPMAAGVAVHDSQGEQAGKLEALDAHQTQMALSGARMRRLANRQEFYSVLPASPYPPSSIFPWRPPAWLRPWLRIDLADESGMRSWRWPDAPLQRDDRGNYRLVAESMGQWRFVRLSCVRRAFLVFDYWGWRLM